ncbi:MAG: HEAT repeat domain-containing protein [Planctomycetota bacterium]
MKKLLQSKTGTVILASVSGLLVAVLVYKFWFGQWWEVQSAMRDIAAGRNIAKARTTLETLDNRQYVLRVLEEAAEDDSYGVRAKYNFLTTLSMLSQPRAVRRALDSRSVAAQRAACWLLYTDPDAKARCAEVALAWLKDEGADERSQAAMLCDQMGVKEAQPVLLAIVQRDPRTDEERNLLMRALNAIDEPKPKELVDRLLKMAGDKALHEDLRAIALESLLRTKDGPREEILALAIGILEDPDANRILRIKAAGGLQDFPEERAWQALEAVLLSEKEDDLILQRNCLFSLGRMEPKDPELAKKFLDRLKQLLLDRRVYHSKYFATRVDVATALCALNVREPITLDIMCDYLVEEDKDDKQHLVRQEGWFTLWTLAGNTVRLPDVPQPDLWILPPQPFPDAQAAREFFFRRGRQRPGIKPEQAAVVEKMAGDLALMQKARQIYQSKKAEIVDAWQKKAQ